MRLATLVYRINANAVLGSTNSLIIQGLLVGDISGTAVPAIAEHGAIHVNLVGDLNLSGVVNVLDVIKLSRIGLDPTPDPTSAAFSIADGNGDGVLDVVDILYHINTILGLSNLPPTKRLADSRVTVSLTEVVGTPDEQVIPLTITGSRPVGGLQASMKYNPSILHIGTPILADGLSNVELVSRVSRVDGIVHLVIFRTDAETVLPADGRSVVLIPVTVVGDVQTAEFALDQVTAATVQAQVQSVSSGVYVYRITSDTGHSEARRMTLLK